MDRLRHWAMGRISKLLGYEDNGAMTDYFLNANDRDQLFEYAGEVLGMEEKAQKFITELWERIEAARDQSKTKTRQHKKKEDDFYEFFPGAVAQKKKSRNRSRSRSRSPAAREEKGRVKVTYVKSKKKEQRE